MARLKAEIIVITFVLTGFAAAQLPENPKPTIDHKFLLLTSAYAAATVGDMVTTSLYVGHDYHACSLEQGAPWLYGRQPRPVRTSLIMGGLFAATTLTSYELKKHHAHIWRVPLWPVPEASMGYGHLTGMIDNLRYCR